MNHFTAFVRKLLSSNRLYPVTVTWTFAAGLALSEGLAHHVLPVIITGSVASAICPGSIFLAWAWHGSRKRGS